jgi:N-hydroxyarylamine O-acetyltransferase
LAAIYQAWCANIPFDNLRKVVAMRTNPASPLPGGDAADFFENWLANGTGGTCWPTSNALFELLQSLGFSATRRIGQMHDAGISNHASVIVTTPEGRWLSDSYMLTNQPLPLDRGNWANGDPVFSAEVETAKDGFLIWFDSPPNPNYLLCRLLPDAVDHACYLQSYERSREQGPFNQFLYARRNRPGEILLLLGHTRFSKSGNGLARRDLSREDLCRALRDEFEVSGEMVRRWVQCGGLDACFEPPSGPKPPPVSRVPPSLR